jgi:hypothetical protein
MNKSGVESIFRLSLLIAGTLSRLSCSAVSQEIKEPQQKEESQKTEATQLASSEIATTVHIMEVLGKVTSLIEPKVREKRGSASSPQPTTNLLAEQGSLAKTFYNPFVFTGKIFQEVGIAKFLAGTVQDEFFVEFSSLNSKELIHPAAQTSLVFWGKKKGQGGMDLQQFSIAVRVQHLAQDQLFPFFSYQVSPDSEDMSLKYVLDLGELDKFHSWSVGVNPSIEIGKMVGSVAVAKKGDLLSLDFRDFRWDMKDYVLAVEKGTIKTIPSKSQMTDFDLKVTATSEKVVLAVTASGADLGSPTERFSIDLEAKK